MRQRRTFLKNTPRVHMKHFSRALFVFFAAVTSAQAWTFTPFPVGTLTHTTDTATLTITYDESINIPYALRITRSTPWTDAPDFSMSFSGPNGFTISTNRHTLSNDKGTLHVEDTGFGNVLNGLEFNVTARAVLGDVTSAFPLNTIGPAMQAFRTCPSTPTS